MDAADREILRELTRQVDTMVVDIRALIARIDAIIRGRDNGGATR